MQSGEAFAAVILLVGSVFGTAEGSDGWYTEGNFTPVERIPVTLTNSLPDDLAECPVTIERTLLPFQNIAYEWITVVDPDLPPQPKPTPADFAEKGAGGIVYEETHGHFLVYQQDDIDKDGIWDELFFMVDLKAGQTKTIYLYIGLTERGLYEHKTHAAFAWYARHPMPFWEGEHIGWKLFYPTDVDMHGKRQPMLTAYPEYQRNLGGYYMPMEFGTDIMAVGETFGAGGICLFENPANPGSLSRPRFSPYQNMGPLHDTRYAYDVVTNGPLRSAVRVKTMNWRTGTGDYELEQLYTAYARKSYCTCRVQFTKFLPENDGVLFGCGIRKVMGEYSASHQGGGVYSLGKDFDPYPPPPFAGSIDVKYRDFKVGFEGIALVVKERYRPEYVDVASYGGNHCLKLPATSDLAFEYMIMGGWNEGSVNNSEASFTDYVGRESRIYNSPPRIVIGSLEKK